MVLAAGTRLGPYEILSPLGAGGMGEVYRARDTRLKRDVAVKVLPEALSQRPDTLARFEREALAVAALSHPNILSLFDVGEESGVRYAVTELLEGETLRSLALRGPVPLRRTLEIVHQLAEALAAAHERGIVHRDVKPDNVFLTKDGHAKVLDFGLARGSVMLRDPEDSRSPTAEALTEAGAVVGTVAYMSPEQASGRPVDHRSDQFSLGVVLYELLVGKRPFARGTAAETLTAIIREEPEPLEKVAPAVPAPVRWLVERLLAKEVAGRYDASRDLARELGSLRAHLTDTTTPPTGAETAATRSRYSRLVLGAMGLALVVTGSVALILLHERGSLRSPAVRFEVRPPEGHVLHAYQHAFDLSPDGKLLVFATFVLPPKEGETGRLFLRPFDSLEARPIPGTEGGFEPVFSPDGQQVAFSVWAAGKCLLRRVAVGGGPILTICESGKAFGKVWGSDGTIYFGSETGPLRGVPATGGQPEPATELDLDAGEVSHRLPHLMPDGRTLVYTALRWTTEGMTWEKVRIYAGRAHEKKRALLAEGGSDGRWATRETILLARGGKLLAAPMDDGVSDGSSGPSTVVIDKVRHAVWTLGSEAETGAAQVALSRNGTLAWSPGSVDPPLVFPWVWVDRSGRESPVEGLATHDPVASQRLSLDGRLALISKNYPETQAEILDLARGTRRRVTFGMNGIWAIWGPGPNRITIASDHEGPMALYTREIDAEPEETQALWKPRDGCALALGSWSPDGEVLAFVRQSVRTGNDIWLLEKGKEPRPFMASSSSEEFPDISPDGLWLLYTSDESDRREVYCRALSGGGRAIQVSASGGTAPLWSRDGAAVYFWQKCVDSKCARSALFRVRVTRVSGSPTFGLPEQILEGQYLAAFGSPGQLWDVAPDGRFLLPKFVTESDARARGERIFPDRIVVDTGGVAHLFAVAKAGR